MQAKAPLPSRSRGGLLASEPLLLIALIILTLFFARELLIPIAFAIVLNFLLMPAVGALQNWRLRRSVAVVLVILVFFSTLGTLGWVVARQLVHVAELLPDYQGNIQAKLDRLHTPLGGAAGHALTSLEEMAKQLSAPPTVQVPQPLQGSGRGRRPSRAARSPEAPTVEQPMPVQVIEPPIPVGTYIATIFTPILKPIGEAGIVMVFTLYMLLNHEDLRNRMLLLAGMGRLNLMTQALNDATGRMGRFLLWQFIVNVCFGVLFGVGLRIIGVPDATLWGALAGMLRYVPYVGSVVGGLLPFVFAVAIFPNFYPAVATVGLIFVLEMVTGNFVEPWLYGAHTGVSSLALLASAIFWSMLWGWAGLVLATPLTVCLIVMGRYVPQMGFLHVLLGDEAELAPEAKFYERLLALDQPEAHAIADRFLEQHSLLELYDTVLLPALGLVEADRHKGGLDETRADFLFLSTAELVTEFSEYGKTPVTEEPQGPLAPPRAPVVCIPASDQADELVATMLAQLLEHRGFNTLLLSAASANEEILERLAQEPSTILCISGMPPFAFTPTRALCKQVRVWMNTNRILVGLWQSVQDPEQTRERFGHAGPDRVVTRLADAIAQVETWQRPAPPQLPRPRADLIGA
ncbi:MAG: AI-2E family transporter [Acidobacteriaceae bacterium]